MQLKVALSRMPTPWAFLLCCIVTQINAFFHRTSQSTWCFQQTGEAHSSHTKTTNLASQLRLISEECLSYRISRHSEALCWTASLKQQFLSLRKIPWDQSVIKKKNKLNINPPKSLRACNTNAGLRDENKTDSKYRKNRGFMKH